MRIPLDQDSPSPLYRQIQEFLRDRIRSGALVSGMRLPSSRELAASLGISRITVMNAYAELESEGLLFSEPGSGTYVASPLVSPPTSGDMVAGDDDWPLWQRELLDQTWAHSQQLDYLPEALSHPGMISFAGGMGASDLFPADDFRKALQTVLRRDGEEALGYGDHTGYYPLRTTIAHILTNQGIPTYPDEVLITSGSQQAIALAAYLLLRSGDPVAVESPTYIGAIDLFRSMGVRLLGVPIDEHGMRTDKLEELLKANQPRLIYTIPTFHNPTGICMSGRRRRQLITLADRYNIPILEDDFVSELRYEGRDQPALKTLDPGGRVIYLRTFSKILMPGLRVGFLVASGPVYGHLVARKHVIDLATSNLVQRALEAFITVGRYQAHLRRICRLYRGRRDAMLDALSRYMPADVQWVSPRGGLFIWLKLPDGVSADELCPVAVQEGVSFAPGSRCFVGGQSQSYVRLNFVDSTSEHIEGGIQRLQRALECYMRS